MFKLTINCDNDGKLHYINMLDGFEVRIVNALVYFNLRDTYGS